MARSRCSRKDALPERWPCRPRTPASRKRSRERFVAFLAPPPQSEASQGRGLCPPCSPRDARPRPVALPWPCTKLTPSSPDPVPQPWLPHPRPTPKSPLMWGPRPPHPKTWTPQNTRGPGLSPPVSGEDGPRSPSVSVASARAAAKVRRGPEATRALPAGFRVTIQSRSLFLAKGGAPGRLPWAWGGGTRWPSRGGAGTAALGGGRRGRPRPRAQARAQALTEVGGPFAVVAGHVGAAAPVALADAALVQRVGGEEHAVTADGLREGGQGLLGRPRGGHRRGAQAGGQRHEASGSV